WPWYSWAPVLGSVVTSDVHRGRCKMNFSGWDGPNEEAWEAPEKVREGEMPLGAYAAAHGDARLTPEEREQLAVGLAATFDRDPPRDGEACDD
ncbi:MAG: heme-binding domain-containing protein, partial [Myxococcota bacterium]